MRRGQASSTILYRSTRIETGSVYLVTRKQNVKCQLQKLYTLLNFNSVDISSFFFYFSLPSVRNGRGIPHKMYTRRGTDARAWKYE